jgi:hypothetical protein
MSPFASDTEVYEYIGGIFETAAGDPELGPKFAESGVVLGLNYTDPDSTLVVDMPNQTVHTGPGSGPAPNVELSMSAGTANRFWLGELNLSLAIAKGQVKTTGSVTKLLKLVPSAKKLFPVYRQMLEREGRTDLLTA